MCTEILQYCGLLDSMTEEPVKSTDPTSIAIVGGAAGGALAGIMLLVLFILLVLFFM